MSSDEYYDIPMSEVKDLPDHEWIGKGIGAGYPMFLEEGEDLEDHQNNHDVYPGRMPDHEFRQLPPVAVFTTEFDWLRRDNEAFARRAYKLGRLIDISIIPGASHLMESPIAV